MSVFNLSVGCYDNDNENDLLIDEDTLELSFGDNDGNYLVYVSDNNTQNYLRYAVIDENHPNAVVMYNNTSHSHDNKIYKYICCVCDDFIVKSNTQTNVYKLNKNLYGIENGNDDEYGHMSNYDYLILDLITDQVYLTKYIHYNYDVDLYSPNDLDLQIHNRFEMMNI